MPVCPGCGCSFATRIGFQVHIVQALKYRNWLNEKVRVVARDANDKIVSTEEVERYKALLLAPFLDTCAALVRELPIPSLPKFEVLDYGLVCTCCGVWFETERRWQLHILNHQCHRSAPPWQR
jgi:hypothetical protein